MKPGSSRLSINLLGLLLPLLLSQVSLAAVVLQTDRTSVSRDDILTLTIRVTEGEDLGKTDIGNLQDNFEIIDQRQSSQTSIRNGVRESYIEIILSLSPKRTGELLIGPFNVDGKESNRLAINVSEQQQVAPGSMDSVFVTSEVDRNKAFVQGQILYTLRIFHSVNLEDPSLSDLTIQDTLINVVSENRFQTRIKGVLHGVYEFTYAIFPQKSGELIIPSQSFEAEERSARRSLFDRNRGRRVRVGSEETAIDVEGVPTSWSGGHWLPAQQLKAEETWSRDPSSLAVGESVTRVVTLNAEGALGAQLPPLVQGTDPGLKFYPEQPIIEDNDADFGVSARRVETTAIVATRPGQFEIPEVRIPWWNTTTDKIETAVIPGRLIQVKVPTNMPVAADHQTPAEANTQPQYPASAARPLAWQIATGVSSAAFLIMLLLWNHERRKSYPTTGTERSSDNANEHECWTRVVNSSRETDLRAFKTAIMGWRQCLSDDSASGNHEIFSASQELKQQLLILDHYLYGRGTEKPDSVAILKNLQQLRETINKSRNMEPSLPPLYHQ